MNERLINGKDSLDDFNGSLHVNREFVEMLLITVIDSLSDTLHRIPID
jgi:hypothetical protein